MSLNTSTNTMDDVDRLFQCFKCGVSPPPSAMIERKRRKRKLKQEGSKNEVSPSSGVSSPGSAANGQKSVIDVQLCQEKLVSSTVKVNGSTRGKHISPIVFYGTPHGVPPKKPLSFLRLLREIRVDLSEQDASNLRKEVWATFPRQDEAIKFAKGHANVHIFSYQDHFNGTRRFLVSTYKEFWKRYKTMDPKFRHHYEVIQEGLPCHLYFDLEFNKTDNPEKNGDEMVDLLISVTLNSLFDKYSIEGNEDWIVELDSSTEEKFSRHLIIRIPKTAFKDNSHAGAFVAEICSQINHAREGEERFEKLFVKKDSSSPEFQGQLFVDTAVYSRNRCFRLALSSKAGKKSFLLPSGRFRCKDLSEEDMFMASLICNMDADSEKLLVCKMELDCVKTLQFDTELHNNLGRYCHAPQEFVSTACSSDVSATYFMGKSPFPALDKFVECIASIGNISGKIRSWYWFSAYGLIVYSMSRSRYCERIGREHKSNHVMYVVDLRRAVYYQKCHDPDCSGYRSPLRPIPLDSIPDLPFSSDLGQTMHHGEFSHDNTEYQFVNNRDERDLLSDDEYNTESCAKDPWWIEAVKVADDIENKQKVWEINNVVNTDDEDDSWWMAAEQTASQAEIMHRN
ncbi:DNA-directed primase/polymerase protein-like [Melia azedarach]|uniref:DNA-directed primase/polymerase protein-like n=1 Tax=Melia azedarach TaxID=155640 RepID=A0ACC1X4S3_MELAZ|nr:DNA-directed primase/polymerase protein-like [Melia azedarach]